MNWSLGGLARWGATVLLLLGAAATFILAGNPLGVRGQAPPDPEPDVFQVASVYPPGSAHHSCGGDTCTGAGPDEISVAFPESMGTVDVTVSLTIEYRTTPRDPALVAMTIKSPGEDWVELEPGSLSLRAGSGTTTTLTWVRQGLAPTGEPHSFDWSLRAARSAKIPFSIRAFEAVIQIQATPSQ